MNDDVAVALTPKGRAIVAITDGIRGGLTFAEAVESAKVSKKVLFQLLDMPFFHAFCLRAFDAAGRGD